MHREVSMAIEMATALIAISALIGIIWFTVFMGKGIANDASVEASEVMSRSQVACLESLCSTTSKAVPEQMPIAAVYNILRTYGKYISEFECNCKNCKAKKPEDKWPSKICVLNHLDTGVVECVVSKIDAGYKIVISDVNPDS